MTATIKQGELVFTGKWLGEENYSLVVSGPADVLEALDAGNLSWPSDASVSELAGRKVKFFDGGDSLLEAIYRAK